LIKLPPVTLSDPALLPDRIEGSDDLNPPAAQWVFDPLPEVKILGYIIAPVKGAIGAKQGDKKA